VTLYRQLLLLIFGLFLIMAVGVLAVNLESTRSFLHSQLDSHAQDTATSLGLSMSPHMAEGDLVIMESMVDAVFDRGYYREIAVEDIEGQELLKRHLDVVIEGVPAWFVSWLPLETPRRDSILMAGWTQAGTVYVESHPGYAYLQLWETFSRLALWFALASVAAASLGALGLRVLLFPLREVERQAAAICAREYPIQARLPRTRELRSVVEAMNRMAGKVKEMFADQARTAEHWREQALRDPVTGLGNRRHFEAELENRLRSSDEFGGGTLLLVAIDNLGEINKAHGYEVGDELLRNIRDRIQASVRAIPDAVLARISGAELAVLLPDVEYEQARRLGEALCAAIRQLTPGGEERASVCHIGGLVFSDQLAASEVLARIDSALRQAKDHGPNACRVDVVGRQQAPEALGRQQWKSLLSERLSQSELVLFAQPAVSIGVDGGVMHYELLARLPDGGGGLWTAAVFMPMVRHFGLEVTLDLIVAEKAVSSEARRGADLAVNLSDTVLGSADVLGRLETLLDRAPRRIALEISERGAVQHTEVLQGFGRRVRALGHALGIDHFGRGFSSFGYLQSLRPDYLKLDGALVRGLDRNPDHRFLLETIRQAAHSLDILVIAESVEKESEKSVLREMGVDGIQGFVVGKPVKLEEE